MCKDRKSKAVGALLAGALLLPFASVAEQKIAVGRYIRVTTEPTASQLNPLETVVTVKFPRGQIDTVGAAASYLLSRSGYALAGAVVTSNPEHQKVLHFPLPDVQRQFQLVTVLAALDALGGPPYQPHINHVDRIVTYQLRNAYRHLNEQDNEQAQSETRNTNSVVEASAPSVAQIRRATD